MRGKNSINVIDLDNTLLPYNSWVKYVIFFLGNTQCFLPIFYLSLLRLLGILPRGTYQKKVISAARKVTSYPEKVKAFGTTLFQDVNDVLVHFIQENTDPTTMNIICTASPEDYVKYLSERLGWRYLCSTLNPEGTQFFHMFRETKVIALQAAYPRQDFVYRLAISDDKHDLGLLRLFQKYYLIRKGFWRRKKLPSMVEKQCR